MRSASVPTAASAARPAAASTAGSATVSAAGPRSEAADILRGLLILAVVFGHALQFIAWGGRDGFWQDPVFRGLYMVHMPLFMALAGYFSPPGVIAPDRLFARIGRLIRAMLPWVLVAAVLKAATQGRWPELAAMSWGGFLNLYWFLWALIMALILVAIGARLGRAAPVLYLGVMALLLSPGGTAGWLVLPLFAFTLPFFLAGRFWRQHLAARRARGGWRRRSRGRRQTAVLAALPLAVTAFLLWDRGTYAYNNGADLLADPGRVALMYLGAGSATLIAAILLWSLARALRGGPAGRGLAHCGRLSLQIYLAQDLAFAGLRAGLDHIPGAGAADPGLRLLTALWVAAAVTGAILALRGLAAWLPDQFRLLRLGPGLDKAVPPAAEKL